MIATVLSYVTLLGLMFLFQRKLQYLPNGHITKISDYSLEGFEEKTLTTSDNQKILSWYKAALPEEKLIVYFHGNAGNMADRSYKFDDFAANGFGVLAISYRGYSGSEGKPTEKNLIADSEAALNFLLDNNYTLQDLIFYGESLGSSVAVQLAARFDPYALILESPFSSAADIGQKPYWFMPVKLMMHDKFESIKFTSKISAKTLIFHGTADEVVPYSQGQELFNSFESKKKFITLQEAGHLDFSSDFLINEMNIFLKDK